MVVFINTTGFELCARAPVVSPHSHPCHSPSRTAVAAHVKGSQRACTTKSAAGRSCTAGSASCTLLPDGSGTHAAAPWAPSRRASALNFLRRLLCALQGSGAAHHVCADSGPACMHSSMSAVAPPCPLASSPTYHGISQNSDFSFFCQFLF